MLSQMMLSELDAALSDLVPLSQAPKLLERAMGKRLHKHTLIRWYRDGISTRQGRRRLRCVAIGQRLFTRKEWLLEFFKELVAANQEFYEERDGHHQQTPSAEISDAASRRRQREVAATNHKLEEAGW